MIKGFSRLSKKEKIDYLIQYHLVSYTPDILKKMEISEKEILALIEGFSENVISSYPFPYSIAPNFLIDGIPYIIPMVTEESSVVAAAAKSASYWNSRGGFKTEILGFVKKGHVHFKLKGNKETFIQKFEVWKSELLGSVERINKKMADRGGGILELELHDKTNLLEDYFQVEACFDTCNAMGANYINSCLEGIGEKLVMLVDADSKFEKGSIHIIMAILSNYSPDNAVRVSARCSVNHLDDGKLGMHPSEFANRFCEAVAIAVTDTSRAVTHNKGIYNGIDAVALATGNDWRAIEANGHAFASASGAYRSLSSAKIQEGILVFEAVLPMQVGTVGGITTVHPLAKLSMKILGNPSAKELMSIIASVGLASNFGAVRSLVTTGIQKGHMKMHLSNILAGLYTNSKEKRMAEEFFSDKTVTYSAVEEYINKLRK